ncbi:hypothetical protein BU23DRAFT_452655 [Bimuria novae-zelandiae CBS 107.79]|uniref:Uncharacterized protein n=1 Tax=Bimuria novae-zelandiae CBS 107.79 TaxID=1447943 RepID=A0A6A5VL83_9PLEO|nr:hypothetical protein BU23DRAFT_452655 [Bimuria novae-zelandiae CBS 107.79]
MTGQSNACTTSLESKQPWTSILGQYDDATVTDAVKGANKTEQGPSLSLFEAIITNYPPVLESLLAQITTSTLLDLYHTSKYLRDFLKEYPLAWKTLSFRLPQPAMALGSPGNETPDGRERQSKAYSFDALLKRIIGPNGSVLTSLDLCNTAVSGTALTMQVLGPHSNTLRHLSVRGCKNVSIKYHIVPFLEPFTMDHMPDSANDLALKSLYTYRCRHHRRRPYLPSSLTRRDSDSDPTHQLIEICHRLGIWTDTAWCPTPGGRCYRRKDYHAGRAGPQNMEVWVPYDRLWRSSNRIGPVDRMGKKLGDSDGRLWEISETGEDGEPLGTESGISKGEGKHVPAHLRQSHKTFVENVQCAQCNEEILERCESCSVRMHCMGCRKTLCASCAFNRPIPKKKAKTRHFASLAFGPGSTVGSTLSQASGSNASLQDQNSNALQTQQTDRFWWAPGATRSPNLMNENTQDDDSDSEDGGNINHGLPIPPANRDPPKLNMHWCCLEPIFSGGGGIAVLGTGLGGRGADKIRAAPLPRTKEFEDPDFSNQLRPIDYIRELKNNGLYEYVLGEDVDLLSYLKQDSLDLQAQTCPRGLCQDCYRSFRWKVTCRTCKNPICKEHDFRALKFRKCGYRDMHTEREHVRAHTDPPRLVIPEFNPNRNAQRAPTGNPSFSQSSSSLSADFSLDGQTPLSQSQILVPAVAPTSVEMSATNSVASHSSNFDPFASNTPIPFVPVSSSRPRSLSTSGVRSRNVPSWSNSPRVGVPNPIANPLPLPCHPRHPVQWEGCGAYFCQYPRPVGDNRPQCPTIMKECTECAVLVCDQCTVANPACTCTYCTVNFHCPRCFQKPDVKKNCRFDAENRARLEEEMRARERLEKEKEGRSQADELAGAVFEFFKSLYTDDSIDDDGPSITHQEIVDLVHQNTLTAATNPLPSPDSITVTTVFGVHEEPSHVTVISGPSTAMHQSYTAEEDEISELDHVEQLLHGDDYEFSESDLDALLAGGIDTTDIGAHLGIDTDSGMNDDGDDADIDTDGFDAESAVIDEFVNDGGLTPIASTSAANI